MPDEIAVVLIASVSTLLGSLVTGLAEDDKKSDDADDDELLGRHKRIKLT